MKISQYHYFKRALRYSFSLIITIAMFSNQYISTAYADDIIPQSAESYTVPADPPIVAEAGVVIEASTGNVLYCKNMNDKMYPASITKILTALVTLEQCKLDEIVDFSHYDVYTLEYGDAHIGMKEGEQLPLIDCLYGVMLASANECANAAGEHVAKKAPAYAAAIESYKKSGQEYNESKVAIQVFADIMNNRAREAGAINSNFMNPNGLFNENHYTTCYDMAMITRAAIKNQNFINIEADTTHTVPATNITAETRCIANRHKMLYSNNKNYYEGAFAGKTGYVYQSGNTLVTCAKRNGMTLICVVMKSNAANVYNDTAALFDYGFNNYKLLNISQNDNKCNCTNINSPITFSNSSNVVIPKNNTFEDLTKKITYTKSLRKAGHTIATANYYLSDKLVGKVNIRLSKDANAAYKFGPSLYTKTLPSKTDKKSNTHISIWIYILMVIVLLFISAIIFILKESISPNKSSHIFTFSNKVKSKK